MPPALLTVAVLAGIFLLFPLALYVLGILKDTFHPLIFFGSVTFFVVVYGVLTRGSEMLAFVSAGDTIFFLLVVLASYLAFAFGWWRAKKRERVELFTPVAAAPTYDASLLIVWACIYTIVGVFAALYTQGDYSATGYFRDLGFLWMVGALLAIQAGLMLPRIRPIALLSICVCLIPPLERFFSYGQRGDTFRIAILAVPIFLFTGKRPAGAIFLPAACLLALVLATMIRTRTLIGNGEATGRINALVQAIPSFFDGKNRSPITGSEEYVFGTAMTATARLDSDYDYGAFIYNLGVRFLPKESFDKDPLYTQWYPTNYIHHTEEHAGFTIPNGSAPTGFAHAFVEFGWFAVIFWALLGYINRRLYLGALTGDLARQGYFVAFFIMLLYLMTQDLYNASMQAVYTFIPLMLAYGTSRVRMTQTVEAPGEVVGSLLP